MDKTYGVLKQQWMSELTPYYGAQETEALLRRVLDFRRSWSSLDLMLNQKELVSPSDQKWFALVLEDLAKLKPVQYVLGETYFYGHRFAVTRDVLIPRPETEDLVDWIVTQEASCHGLQILDIGTGSGSIAISLKLGLSDPKVTAWDVSEAALIVAKSNAKDLSAEVFFVLQNVLTADLEDPVWDIIVSNPPYVCVSEQAEMRPHVLDHEPGLALFVSDSDPLQFYQKIAEIGQKSLVAKGRLYFEINAAFGPETVTLLSEMGYRNVTLKNDTFGKPRMICAVKV
ncbi:MAG: peptide chain release factor N(5)-glutamine methyltransferase [Flavobacteriaceae bacterium]|jgi:release factor glutamine methyltransferase